jgi:hypothetical protein
MVRQHIWTILDGIQDAGLAVSRGSERPDTWENHGGEGGIRTHGTVSRTLAFEASTFNRSVTSPQSLFTRLAEELAGRQRSLAAI